MDYNHSRSSNGSYNVLGHCLEEILSLIKPLENDRLRRLNTINELTNSILSIATLKGAVVNPFGSFVSNLYSKWGDLDVSIDLSHSLNLSASKKQKQNILREIMKTLRRNGIARNIHFIPQARVPLLEYESNLFGISCDVSVDNHIGGIKSQILGLITSFDERFADLVLLIKEWAKAQNINDPKSGTLNSYSLCLLVIFHLQTCEPPIIPPLQEIYRGNIADDVTGMFSTEKQIKEIYASNIQRIILQISQPRNCSSLSQLFASFFHKFSEIESLSSNYVICTQTGQWEKLTNNPRWMEKPYCLLIEDPFEQPDNAARAVGLKELRIISQAFKDTHLQFSSPVFVSDRNSLLSMLSRPTISLQLGVQIKSSRYPRATQSNHQQLNRAQVNHHMSANQSNPRNQTVVTHFDHTPNRNHMGNQRVEFGGLGSSFNVEPYRAHMTGYAVVEPASDWLSNQRRIGSGSGQAKQTWRPRGQLDL